MSPSVSTSTPADVCVVGSANLDLVATTARLPRPGETVSGSSFAEHPGGKGLNQAVAAARSGALVSFHSAVGPDAAGEALLAVLAAEGISPGAVATVGQPTGRALIGVSESGENSIIVVPGANAAVVADEMGDAAIVLTQLEVPVATVANALRTGRTRGAVTVLNPAPAAELTDELLALCNIVIPNEHEVELLGGITRLLDCGVDAVVVTLGASGAALHTRRGDTAIAPFAVTAIDTTGAGDAFCGALAAQLADRVKTRGVDGMPSDADVVTALRYACAAGALATTVRGAVPSLPRRADVLGLLSLDD